jgi:uncharacterized protein YndB with AHSA1/START domain
MPAEQTHSAPATAGEIVNVRAFTAARAAVFAAFADPAALAQWWGPKGFTNDFHVFEFRSGGIWRFTMRAPDGASYAMDHRFGEIIPARRIVVRHLQAGHEFSITVELTERAGKTELTWRQRFDDPAEGERLRGFLTGANEENLDRLAAVLAGKSSTP